MEYFSWKRKPLSKYFKKKLEFARAFCMSRMPLGNCGDSAWNGIKNSRYSLQEEYLAVITSYLNYKRLLSNQLLSRKNERRITTNTFLLG